MPVVFERSTVSAAYRHPTTLLLSERKPRLQQSKRRSSLDDGKYSICGFEFEFELISYVPFLIAQYGTDGKEDLEYRLLHVYFSAKRAVNKGVRSKPSPPIKRKRTSPTYGRSVRQLPPVVPASSRAKTPPLASATTLHPGASISPSMSFDMEPLDLNSFVTPDANEFARFCGVPNLDPNAHEPTLQELESCWIDPFVPLDDDPVRMFSAKLQQISQSIQDLIHSSPEHQGHLCIVLSDWAKQLAADPLGDVTAKRV